MTSEKSVSAGNGISKEFLVCPEVRLALDWVAMKVKEPTVKTAVPFDPVLFAATVPSRKPTPKDIEDCKEREDDAIEPQEYDSMEDMVKDL